MAFDGRKREIFCFYVFDGIYHIADIIIFLDVLGYILARDIFAKEPYPPFAASVKDGYAVVGIKNSMFTMKS